MGGEEERKPTAERRDGTIHWGHVPFIVSGLLSSALFLFVLFISPFERFGSCCVSNKGGEGVGVGRQPSRGLT